MYRFFDGVVACEFPLPGLPEVGSAQADIQVRLGSGAPDEAPYEWFHSWRQEDDNLVLACARCIGESGARQYLLRFPELADFEIIGDSIICFPGAGCRQDSLRHLLLDQVIPRVWASMGHLIVHASSVRFTDGRVVAFVGESGWGKSTLAAALVARGHLLISDDSVCLRVFEGGVQLVPSYTGLRLNDDSIGKLGMANHDWVAVSHYSDKRRFESVGSESLGPHHLNTLYVMEEPGPGQSISIGTLPGADLLTRLIKRSFLLDIRDGDSAIRQMGEAGDVLRAVPNVRTLSYCRDYGQLSALCDKLTTTEASQRVF
jgi:hypothetical protein